VAYYCLFHQKHICPLGSISLVLEPIGILHAPINLLLYLRDIVVDQTNFEEDLKIYNGLSAVGVVEALLVGYIFWWLEIMWFLLDY
jgi:hypothetical protein